MPRMRILSASEQEQFEKPPYFDAQQRKNFLEFPEGELITAQTFRKPSHQIGFLVGCGYFKATKRFFSRYKKLLVFFLQNWPHENPGYLGEETVAKSTSP